MKKLFLLVYLLSTIAFYGYAQNLSLSYQGIPVANDEAVIFTGEPTTPVIESHISVTNIGSNTLSVMCKKEEIVLVPGSVNFFCWDNCYPPNVYVSMGPLEINPGDTNNAFIGEYQPESNAGQSIIRYVFYDQNDPNDSVCFRAFYNAYPLGVETRKGLAFLSHPYPNPANAQTTFTYRIENGTKAILRVRNLLGLTVIEQELSGSAQISLSTIHLSEGVYFYSVEVNGQTQSTRKLIVSH